MKLFPRQRLFGTSGRGGDTQLGPATTGRAAPEREHVCMMKNQNGQRQDLITFVRAIGTRSLGVLDVNTCRFGIDRNLAPSGFVGSRFELFWMNRNGGISLRFARRSWSLVLCFGSVFLASTHGRLSTDKTRHVSKQTYSYQHTFTRLFLQPHESADMHECSPSFPLTDLEVCLLTIFLTRRLKERIKKCE